jgi:hypothetical protein
MLRKSIASAIVVFALATLCLAADFGGRWEGKIPGPNGQDLELVFNFTVDGDKLTGTVESSMGNADITDGKVTAEGISFAVQTPNGAITHNGTLSGETMLLKVHGPWGDSELTLKRPAAK